MIGLLPYIDQVLQIANQSSSDRSLRKVENGRLIFWLSLLLGLASYTLVMVGTAIYLLNAYDSSVALCVIGLINLLTMLMIVGIHQLHQQMRRRKIEKIMHSVTKDVSNFAEDITNKFGDGLKDNALLLAVLSAGVGYFLSRKIF